MRLRSAPSLLGILLTLILGSGCMTWMRRTPPQPPVTKEPPDQVALKTPPVTGLSPYAEVVHPGPSPGTRPPMGRKETVQRTEGRTDPLPAPASLVEKKTQEVPPSSPGPQATDHETPPPARLPAQLAPPPVEPVVAALECILRSQHQEALAHLKKYDGPTQELFLRLLPAVALMTQKGLTGLNASEVGLLNEQLHGLLATLRPRTELGIDKACFCSWVKSYGVYKPLPEGHAFVPSTPNGPGELVQLYVELRNFVSELRGDQFETRLSSSVEIADGNGQRLWYYGFEDGKMPLRSRTMLHDWFSNYTFYAPHLPPGTYRLTITVTDETRPDQRRTARRSLEYRVAAVAARIP